MTTMALASILSRSMTLIGTACGEVSIRAKNRPCDLNAGPQVPMNILKTERLAANE